MPQTGPMSLITTVLVAVLQVLIFALVPFAWWLSAARPDGTLRRWLGFRAGHDGSDPLVLGATIAAALGFFGGALLSGSGTTTAGGVSYFGVLAVAVVAIVQTALSEELFFRGFLVRWLGERRPGPIVANLLQALACGLLRMAGQWLFVDRALAPCLAAFALGVGPALMVGWVRQRTGSLWLPWLAHGSGNLVAGLIAMATR